MWQKHLIKIASWKYKFKMCVRKFLQHSFHMTKIPWLFSSAVEFLDNSRFSRSAGYPDEIEWNFIGWLDSWVDLIMQLEVNKWTISDGLGVAPNGDNTTQVLTGVPSRTANILIHIQWKIINYRKGINLKRKPYAEKV